MRKLLAILALAGLLFAANDVLIVGNATAITGDFTTFWSDTITTHVDSGLVHIKFSRPVFNVIVTSINPAGDSGYCSVYGGTIKAVMANYVGKATSHTDGTARAYWTHTVGDNSEADTIKFYMGIRDIWYQAAKGGTADSTCILLIKGVQ